MSSHPVKRKARAVRTIEGDVVESPAPVVRKGAGFNFRFSYAEISSAGGSARLKAKRARYEDGRLSAESFEGELDPKTYLHLMNDVQRFVVEQTALYLQAFRSFLPPFGQGRDRE